MQHRDLALTVIQLEFNEFHWVLMEPVEVSGEDVLCYSPVDSSAKPFGEYGEALIAGAVALRQLQGLAVLGVPPVPVGINAVSPTLPAPL
jgi:hypothetical protein